MTSSASPMPKEKRLHQSGSGEKANEIGYPVLIRPSYVIGGMGMMIVHSEAELRELLGGASQMPYPILIDQYVSGKSLKSTLSAMAAISTSRLISSILKSGRAFR
ncbi:hypothetical protein PO124_22985 [Bacillus licheniformis]|nr:hypothetical protein [Bacillus licheniformis]